jgi:hypothetical protein
MTLEEEILRVIIHLEVESEVPKEKGQTEAAEEYDRGYTDCVEATARMLKGIITKTHKECPEPEKTLFNEKQLAQIRAIRFQEEMMR